VTDKGRIAWRLCPHEFVMHSGGVSGGSSVPMTGWSALLSGEFKKERHFWYLFDFSCLKRTTSFASFGGPTSLVHPVY
jgi:hypothetical protein